MLQLGKARLFIWHNSDTTQLKLLYRGIMIRLKKVQYIKNK